MNCDRMPEKEFCKQRFDTYLVEKLGQKDSDIEWQDVKEDKPDYYLLVKGMKYAIEVTSIIGPRQLLPPKWEGRIQQHRCHLLQANLTRKACELSRVEFPKILLLLNEYPFTDSTRYKECTLTQASLDYFHTIFIVGDKDRGYILYTKDLKWWEQIA